MVQWLILGAYTAWGTGSIPGQGIKIPDAAWYDQIKQTNKQKKQMAARIHPILHALLVT